MEHRSYYIGVRYDKWAEMAFVLLESGEEIPIPLSQGPEIEALLEPGDKVEVTRGVTLRKLD